MRFTGSPLMIVSTDGSYWVRGMQQCAFLQGRHAESPAHRMPRRSRLASRMAASKQPYANLEKRDYITKVSLITMICHSRWPPRQGGYLPISRSGYLTSRARGIAA